MIHPGKIGLGRLWEVISLMKKSKNAAKNNIIPDSSALEGIPNRNPHDDYAKKDAQFKKHRGAQ